MEREYRIRAVSAMGKARLSNALVSLIISDRVGIIIWVGCSLCFTPVGSDIRSRLRSVDGGGEGGSGSGGVE